MGCALVTTSYVPIASRRVPVISSGVEKSLKNRQQTRADLLHDAAKFAVRDYSSPQLYKTEWFLFVTT